MEGHTGWINCLAVDPTADRLYSGSFDKTIKVWDLKTFKCVETWAQHAGSVEALFVDKTNVYSGSTDGTVIVWDKVREY